MSLLIINGESVDLGSSQEIYSEEETVIGTWIDGKPFYRRIFVGFLTTVSSSWSYIIPPLENAEVKYVTCFTTNEAGTVCQFVYSGSSSGRSVFTYSPVTGFGIAGLVSPSNYIITVKYTKTTDEVKSSTKLSKSVLT